MNALDCQKLKKVMIFASCGEEELERLLEGPHKVSTFQPGEMMVRFGPPLPVASARHRGHRGDPHG